MDVVGQRAQPLESVDLEGPLLCDRAELQMSAQGLGFQRPVVAPERPEWSSSGKRPHATGPHCAAKGNGKTKSRVRAKKGGGNGAAETLVP